MVSQVWEGVSRMTALAKQTTQAFLEGSAVLGQPLLGTPSANWRLYPHHGKPDTAHCDTGGLSLPAYAWSWQMAALLKRRLRLP